MNAYQFRINDTEQEMMAAMDVQNYSHLTPARHGQRFVVFAARNHREATAFAQAAMGRLYRRGTHVPFLATK